MKEMPDGSRFAQGLLPSADSLVHTVAGVNPTLATERRDRWGGHFRRPDVLRKMPLSCGLVFGAFAALANRGGELQASTRTLAQHTGLSEVQVRRALRRLVAVRLIEIVQPGRGRIATTYRLRWRGWSFPQGFASSPTRARGGVNTCPSGNEKSSSDETAARAGGSPAQPKNSSQLRGESCLSPKAERWAIAEFRRRLARWNPESIADLTGYAEDGLASSAVGLDIEHVLQVAEREDLQVWEDELATLGGPDREIAMLLAAIELKRAVVDGFAVALHRNIRKGRIRTGRELGCVVERIAEVLNEEAEDWLWPWLSERCAIAGGPRPVFAWVGRLVRVTIEGLEEARAEEEARQREAEERARVQAEWRELAASGFSFTREMRRQSAEVEQAELNAAVAQLAAVQERSIGASGGDSREAAGAVDHLPTATSSGKGGRGAKVRGRASAPVPSPVFQWRALPDGSGYWVLGGKPAADQLPSRDQLPSEVEAEHLRREFEQAEAEGDHERAGKLFRRLYELRRALIGR